MQLGLLALCAWLVASQEEPGIFKRLAAAGEDLLEKALNDFDACSCSCCQATARTVQEQERSADGTSLVTHKCIHPYPAKEKCPAECVARDADHSLEKEQFVSRGAALDYGRYCFHNCVPTMMINGGSCALPEQLAQRKNLTASPPSTESAWHPGDLEMAKEAQPSPPPMAMPEEVPLATKEEAEMKEITWDLRAIRAQRDRAEEAAAKARAVYDAERVKLHTHEIKRTAKMLDRVKKSVSKDAKSYEPEVLKAKANASAAGDAAVETYNVLKKAKAQLRKVRQETREVARKMLVEATAAAAQSEAESYVRRLHQDDLPHDRRQVANAASLPYVTTASTGRERESQYLGVAEEDEGRAREAEIKMDALEKQAKELETAGDRVAAGMMKREATSWRHQAEDAKASAERNRATAAAARKSAIGWQQAAEDASAHVAHMYDLSVATTPTPPPLVAIPLPPAFR